MTQLLQSSICNKLLRALNPLDFSRLVPHLELIDLPRLHELASPGLIANYCYFPESGLGSIVAGAQSGRKAEVGMFGREGMSPTSLVLHAPAAPFSTYMQIAGHGYRLQSIQLSHALEESFTLRTLLLRFAQVMTVQASFTALSNATDRIEQRLARWLLMCHDRSDGETIALTHAFVSDMLAVRRQSITTALHVLEGHHLISAERNQIAVVDRRGLEEFAGAAYGPAEEAYRSLIGPF